MDSVNFNVVFAQVLYLTHASSFAFYRHVDLYYEDGGNPSEEILQAFLQLCETERGAIAVHCKAGLGRTGTNIAAYMMKHYGYTARETMAWCRCGFYICVFTSKIVQSLVFRNKHRTWMSYPPPLRSKFPPFCHSCTQTVSAWFHRGSPAAVPGFH